jgi:hypothetical protein
MTRLARCMTIGSWVKKTKVVLFLSLSSHIRSSKAAPPWYAAGDPDARAHLAKLSCCAETQCLPPWPAPRSGSSSAPGAPPTHAISSCVASSASSPSFRSVPARSGPTTVSRRGREFRARPARLHDRRAEGAGGAGQSHAGTGALTKMRDEGRGA